MNTRGSGRTGASGHRWRIAQAVWLLVAVVLGVALAGRRAGAQPMPSQSPAVDPLSYATLPTEADIPPGLTPEQRRAIGDGLVPIHREGMYRSPLAHPRFGAAATVQVGLVLNRIRHFDIVHGTFDADFFLSLTSDRPMPDLHLTFTNGQDVQQSPLVETATFKFYRVQGEFSTEVDLRSYPFDTQRLQIEFEDARVGVDQVIFEANPARTSLDEGFFVSGWNVGTLGARTWRHLYPPRFDRDDLYVSRYRFTLGVDRFGTSAAFSVFIPALIIVLISLTGLWMGYGHVDVRSGTGAPMLAAAVLFHYSLISTLPATGYLTRADKLMLGVYVSLLLNMLSTWAFFIFSEDDHDRVFRVGRAVVPIVTVGVMVAASVV